MPPTTIHECPIDEEFTDLEEHQAQTPSSFYNAKPVLHYKQQHVRALASRDQIPKLPVLGPGADASSQPASAALDDAMTVQFIDVWISSENLTLFNQATHIGMSIPYPSISLHAIQRLADPAKAAEQVQGLYMQLDLSDPNAVSDEDFEDEIELTLIPDVGEGTEEEAIKKLFSAISNCSNLHPDPAFGDGDDGEGEDDRIIFEGSVGYEGISGLPGVQQGVSDGGLPPPFPGSGGWITAENVGNYFDEEGNWIRDGEEPSLGEGAGRIRTREEMDGPQVNGDNEHESDESKRPRTD
ncbi:uncharacterized protein L3040_002645 [Drepanopeziza brunnea f. sp. 'multigermtubi']|uniref:uncharacterized protein n=1 Tax=Drepanopeziza brunnea f. sp. 'multigermtubi' TaxID=698441 RepID=UPI00238ED784|nr:hypothetical protein L3040_002645 [Drepanopeziza brunnea f. sp. 'multigermtubi']